MSEFDDLAPQEEESLEEHPDLDDEADEGEGAEDLIDSDSETLIGRKINFVNQQRRVSDLKNDYAEGLLKLDPTFQRNYIWKEDRASLLVESILLNVPIPLIYTAEDGKTGVELVVDGQQRLQSLFLFLSNAFPLKNLKVFKDELEGKRFSDMDRNYQLKILRYPLPVVTISADSDEDVKFEIFERINSGAIPLNAQEIRNCIYHGSYNEFIKNKLAKDPLLLELVYGGVEPDRMQNVETVLRFTSFYLDGYAAYPGRLRSFINEHLKKHKNIYRAMPEPEQEKKFAEIHKAFRKSLELSKMIFGQNAFQTCYLSKDKSITWRGQVVFTLYDVVMYGFTLFEKNQIVPKMDAIREALITIMIDDPKFIVTKGGGFEKGKLKYRFNKWVSELQDIVGAEIQPRSFSLKLKKSLFDATSTCFICNQEIRSIDDAEVDHHVPYWKGGATIPENARLTHRYCNRVKSGR